MEVKLRAASAVEQASLNGLLDSGASHPMRSATTEEYEAGHPVAVTLAGEDVKVLKQYAKGTVLIQSEEGQTVQPIIPLGSVIEDLGCSLHWKRGSLQLLHPQRGVMKVKLINNCPEINAKDAHALIKELETKHLASLSDQVESLSARLEVMRKEEKKTWFELMDDYIKTGSQATLLKVVLTCPFTSDLPEDVQAMLAEGFEVDQGKQYLKWLPLTRRKRKALMTHDRWVVLLRSEENKGNDDLVDVIPKGGKIVLEVNTRGSKLWDTGRRNGVYRLLCGRRRKGRSLTLLEFLKVKLGCPQEDRMKPQGERQSTRMDFLNYHLFNNNKLTRRQLRLLDCFFFGCCP